MKIYELGKIDKSILNNVGGKASGLDFLKKNNFNIANGYVLTELDDFDDNDLKEVQNLFNQLNTASVAIRSSCSDEDGLIYSNAGQYETVLSVTKETVKEAILKCLASKNSERAKSYSTNMTASTTNKMNIIIQEMVKAKYAGVMFSKNPTSKDDVLIEVVEGLGESLVSGVTSSHRYSIPNNDFILKSDGFIEENIIKTVYEEGLKTKGIYNQEVDLEWAINDNNELVFLQLRPITTAEEASLDEFNTPNDITSHLLTTRNVGEMLSGAITPLSISTSVLAIDYGIRNLFKEVGVTKRVDSCPDYYTVFAYKGHLFMDMSALHTICDAVFLTSIDALNISIMGEVYDNTPKIKQKKVCFFKKLINTFKFCRYLFSSKKAIKRLKKYNQTLAFNEKEDINKIYEEIDSKLYYLNNALSNHYVCSTFSGSMNSAFLMTIGKEFENKNDYQAFISRILSNIKGIESADILKSLRNLSRLIKKEFKNANQLSNEELLEFIKTTSNNNIKEAFDYFIIHHGHRCLKEAELRQKGWKDDLLSLMDYLKVVMSGNDEEVKDEEINLKELFKDYKYSMRKILIWIAKKARQGVRDRECSKSNIIKVIDSFKTQYRLLAKLLVERHYLLDEDSIYFLSHKEIKELINGRNDLKKLALARRKIFVEQELLRFQDISEGTPKPIEISDISKINSLNGVPVCEGIVIGKARIVHSLFEAKNIQKGDIMVAPFTDIGFSPYYSLISSLITEVGSALSHGAVVAREYSLPTIVDVKGATSIIHDGDYLYVDAKKGNISILDENEYIKLQSR